MKRYAERHGKLFHSSRKSTFRPNRPAFPDTIRFLAGISNLFSNKSYARTDDGHFFIPACFSLLDNYEESFDFLKRLFITLYKWKTKKIVLDYKGCERIDVDASICMDVILAEFINHRNNCIRKGYQPIMPESIRVVNTSDQVRKVLFSIGAFRNLRGFTIKYKDVEPLPVLVNYLKRPEVWAKNEIDLTKIVEYIKACLKRMDKTLSVDAESEFYKVIGEVLSNADEHATEPYRYAIGFFQESTSVSNGTVGVFNFSIFNFGNSIYQTFKSPSCKNLKAINEMESLSAEYTKKGWLRKADFEEETLWTLYSLQEGITSKEKRRGNGSIGYIENFFKLKTGTAPDSISKMVIISGYTRILFDGKYSIKHKTIPGRIKPFKIITFNESGKIEDKPDKNYVTFAPHYFPGAIISARILNIFNEDLKLKNDSVCEKHISSKISYSKNTLIGLLYNYKGLTS